MPSVGWAVRGSYLHSSRATHRPRNWRFLQICGHVCRQPIRLPSLPPSPAAGSARLRASPPARGLPFASAPSNNRLVAEGQEGGVAWLRQGHHPFRSRSSLDARGRSWVSARALLPSVRRAVRLDRARINLPRSPGVTCAYAERQRLFRSLPSCAWLRWLRPRRAGAHLRAPALPAQLPPARDRALPAPAAQGQRPRDREAPAHPRAARPREPGARPARARVRPAHRAGMRAEMGRPERAAARWAEFRARKWASERRLRAA